MPTLYKRKNAEILVNTETAGTQSSANLALLPGGGFVVVWIDGSALGGDTSGFGIKGQRFDADGNKLGGEFLINTTTAENQTSPIVATLASGRFVVTWIDTSATGGDTTGTAVRGQIFEASGTPVGAEFLINTQTANNQGPANITELSGGGFVVSWSDASGIGGDDSGTGIKAQLFDSAGAKVGGEILVNTAILGSQGSSSLIALAGGGFAAAWQGATASSGGVITGSIRLQLFNAAGAKVGVEQVVNTNNQGNFNTPNITALPTGFIVAWTQQDSPQGVGIPVTFDVRAQLFDAGGAKLGAEFVVNTATAGTQSVPDVDAVPGGGFLVTWQGPNAVSGDFDIYGQFFDAGGARVGTEFVVNQATGNNQVGAKVDVLPSGDIVVIWTDSSGVSGDASSSGIKMVVLTPSTAAPTDIALSNTDITEVAIENLAIANLSAFNAGGLNSAFTYQIVSDSSGGAFRIEGGQLVVDDNAKLDFETQPNIALRIRATDINGTSYEENFTISLRDVVSESRYAAGDEFRVNGDTLGFNTAIAMTALGSGGFAVVTHWFEIGIGDGLRLHIFDSAGAAIGPELDLDLSDRGGSSISLAGLSGGGFVIVYEGNSIDLGGGSNGFPIRAQRFDAAGNEVGGDLIVSQTNGGILTNPEVTTLSNGGFVVTWQLPIHEDGSDGGPFPSQIMARVYDPAGVPLGNEFRANTGIANSQGKPEVAALPGGGFVVAWEEFESGAVRVEGQIFNAPGAKVGGEFLLSSLTISGDHEFSEFKLTTLASGSVLVSWVQRFLQNPDVYEIKGRLLAPDGTMGAPFLLVAATLGPSHEISALPGGGFVLTADTLDHVDPALEDYQSFGLIFDASGARVGDGFALPESTAEDEIGPFVATLNSGDLAFTWTRQFLAGNSVTSDTYARVLTLEDSAINGTPGPDDLTGTSGNDVINGLGDSDILRGEDGNDMLFGNEGNDFLVGGAGADIMVGGTGNDTYYIDDTSDAIGEQAGEGVERIAATITLALAADADIERIDVVNLTSTNTIDLTGSGIANVIYGNDGQNILRGEAGNDELRGFGGSDFLVGGTGTDLMVGGLGDDTFYVDDASDAIGEIDGEGNDRIAASVSFVLSNGANVELLEAVNLLATTAFDLTGSDSNNTITGNNGVNILRGEGGNDVLSSAGGDDFLVGGAGVDAMTGGAGNDTYYVDNASDIVAEIAGEGSADRVAASVSFALSASADIEQLEADPQTGTNALNLTGSSIFNTITGNDGANVIDGKLGNDTLIGRGGADSFAFTTALGAGNIDFFVDFVSGTDKILLDQTIFTGLPLGTLSPNAFSGSGSNDGDDRIIFNPGLGFIFFDADGGGPGSAVAFALLQPGGVVTASDFQVI